MTLYECMEISRIADIQQDLVVTGYTLQPRVLLQMRGENSLE